MSTFDHHPWTVNELVNGVNRGEVRLPDIQRPFVWPNAKIRDLVDSMYRGYPVGELMFWRNVDPVKSKTIGVGEKSQAGSFQVVDGQQRMTSLFATVTGTKVVREDYSKERVQIAFNPLSERFEVGTNKAISNSAEWISDIVPVFSDPIQARYDYLDRLRTDGRHTVDQDLERTVERRIQRLTKLLDYKFEVVQLKEDVDREVVADIFVRINSEGVTLTSADFILTWLSVFWEEGRAELEKWARDSRFSPAQVADMDEKPCTWTPLNPYLQFSPGQILRVAVAVGLDRARLDDAYQYLRGRDPRTREIVEAQRDQALAQLQEGQKHATNPLHWDEFLHVLDRAGFRNSDLITSNNAILYTYALWIMGRVRYQVPVDELRELMARWFFMAQATGRYTNSPESRMAEEIQRLRDIAKTPVAFTTLLNEQITAAVPDDWWRITLVDGFVTSSIKSPIWVAYVAALNILDADVLLSTTKIKDWVRPGRRPVKGIEKHHLFPRDYLKTQLGIKYDSKINQVANYALVAWSDNITISNQAPKDYWPAEVAAKTIGDDWLARQQGWHGLPDNWTEMAYDDFLVARRKLLARVVHEGFKRLSDPNYQPSFDAASQQPEPVPVASLPSFTDLLADGVLPSGTILTPAGAETDSMAEIGDDGLIALGAHRYDSLDIAAREDGADGVSGWDYWVAHLDGENEPVLLAELRERAAG